jgi:hypothetical protein
MSHAPATKAARRRSPSGWIRLLPKPLDAALFPTNEAGRQSLVWDRKNPGAE